MERINILHVITGLGIGGAEMMLLKLLETINKTHFNCAVISLSTEGPLADRIKDLGYPVYSLNMSRKIPNPLKIIRLMSLIRQHRPDIIQTWMYHADLLGGIAAKLSGVNVIWNIRHSNLAYKANRARTLGIVRLCAIISKYVPTKIICCAQSALEIHTKLGYPREKMIVIPNGFDLSRFHPDIDARTSIRNELGLPNEAFLIGMAGRFNPQKDHENFLNAADMLIKKGVDAYFILCGDEITTSNTVLLKHVTEEVKEKLYLLGRRNDMPKINAALDIATLSSVGEAFPNVVGEAMACGIPMVVTDAGDTGMIVGETGIVVPVRHSEALANGWEKFFKMPVSERQRLGQCARKRIESEFELESIIKKYENLYTQTAHSLA